MRAEAFLVENVGYRFSFVSAYSGDLQELLPYLRSERFGGARARRFLLR